MTFAWNLKYAVLASQLIKLSTDMWVFRKHCFPIINIRNSYKCTVNDMCSKFVEASWYRSVFDLVHCTFFFQIITIYIKLHDWWNNYAQWPQQILAFLFTKIRFAYHQTCAISKKEATQLTRLLRIDPIEKMSRRGASDVMRDYIFLLQARDRICDASSQESSLVSRMRRQKFR